ncbi:AAA family ATPase [Camelliibacillus cellulosilyticus]|uniref:AAA family ATPase n=1 Tax=Camelliibacillus cellulosilyticus TaxID=2174486 RepID=A0ABV9GRP5_9BACL
MIHLKFGSYDRYPFTVPSIRSLNQLIFDTPVTIFVGENGTGKSMLIEAVAAATGSIAIGVEGVNL